MKNRVLRKFLTLLITAFLTITCTSGCFLIDNGASENIEGHTFVKSVVNPTCTTAGYDLYTCDCGCKQEYFKNIVQALGHDFGEYIIDNNATLTKDGTKTATCKRENCFATDTVVDLGSKLADAVTVEFWASEVKIKEISVNKGQTVSTPNDPEKENHIFVGWYDTNGDKYDFSKAVNNSFKLTAKYEIDAVKITNTITTDKIKSVVKIYNTSYNKGYLGGKTDAVQSQGSGFCFEIQNGNYYVLTNSHVAYCSRNYQEFVIEDCFGNTYTGYLYSNSNKNGKAISPAYDLACLYFTSADSPVTKMPFASDDPIAGDDVITLGAPKGQKNAITFGKVITYSTITLTNTSKEESDVQFPVINSTAWLNHGSSGGPIINANYQVIGVSYAGLEDGTKSYHVPLSKVKEFLSAYVYS